MFVNPILPIVKLADGLFKPLRMADVLVAQVFPRKDKVKGDEPPARRLNPLFRLLRPFLASFDSISLALGGGVESEFV
jgi:hypothetical protein